MATENKSYCLSIILDSLSNHTIYVRSDHPNHYQHHAVEFNAERINLYSEINVQHLRHLLRMLRCAVSIHLYQV